MPTKTQVGNVLTDSEGAEYRVYLSRWSVEEPSEILIDGDATYLAFDPSAPGGRKQVRDLIARLNEALDAHAVAVEEIYGGLKVGDYCIDIRLPYVFEDRCEFRIDPDPNGPRYRCSRAKHEDDHHVTVRDDFEVIAVSHRVVPAPGIPVHREVVERLLG